MKNDNKTEYWYLRLNYKLFAEKEIMEIKALPASLNGMFFPSFVVHLFLELCCFSIKTNGFIKLDFPAASLNDLSIFVCKLLFSTEYLDSISIALKILISKGLIELVNKDDSDLTNGLFIPAVVDNTGSTTLGSEARRLRRINAKRAGEKTLEENEQLKFDCISGEQKSNITLSESEIQDLFHNLPEYHINHFLENAKKKKEELIRNNEFNYSNDYEFIKSLQVQR